MGGGSHYQRCARCQIRFNFNVQFQFNIFIGVHDARLREERARHCSRFDNKSRGYSGLGQDDVYKLSWRQFKLFLFWPITPGTSRQREAGVGKDERRVAGRERKDAMLGKLSINSESQMFGTKKGAKLNWEEFRCVWTKKLGCFSSHVATSLAVRWRKFISVTIWESESVCFFISTHEKVKCLPSSFCK